MTRRKILTLTGPDMVAKVYRDSEWDEYRVTVAKHGETPNPEASYHTSDKEEAIQHALAAAFPTTFAA